MTLSAANPSLHVSPRLMGKQWKNRAGLVNLPTMSNDNQPFSSDELPIFPYRILWAGFGNAYVNLQELERNKEEYALVD